jgi:hypothetical protein
MPQPETGGGGGSPAAVQSRSQELGEQVEAQLWRRAAAGQAGDMVPGHGAEPQLGTRGGGSPATAQSCS